MDKVLIELGVPLDIVEWSHADEDSYKFTPVDDESRESLIDLERMRDKAFQREDYAMVKTLTSDIKNLIEVSEHPLSFIIDWK